MSASILDGKTVAAQLRAELKTKIDKLKSSHAPLPQLAVILLGDDPASSIYVNNKKKACIEAGMLSKSYHLPSTTSEDELLSLINELNLTESVHGILVQLPLPAHIDTTRVIESISPEKDVDGFHPYNIGRLAERIPCLRPCTPLGIMHMLEHYQIPVKRKHAVIVGASNIVGRPMALELLLAGATTTICHKFTDDLKKHIQSADIIVVAVGKMDIVNPDWLLSHQVLIDVGMHRLENGKIRGDVDFEKAKEKVAWITPVPGGVGPMTIATLLLNTWKSYTNSIN